MMGRSACSCVYRWVDVVARPVPVYAPVDECACVYVYMPVNVYVAVAVMYVCMYLLVHPFIHTSMRPSRKLKLKIETIPKTKIEIPNRKSKIQFQICD